MLISGFPLHNRNASDVSDASGKAPSRRSSIESDSPPMPGSFQVREQPRRQGAESPMEPFRDVPNPIRPRADHGNPFPPVWKGPAFSDGTSSFKPPAHQVAEHMHDLMKRETELRDSHPPVSAQWFAHDRNVEFFAGYADHLKTAKGFNTEDEKKALQKEKAEIQTHNRTISAARKGVSEATVRENSHLFKLEGVRWAIQNEQKRTGRKVFGEQKTVPALDAGEKSWFRRSPKVENIEGLTEEGLNADIEKSKKAVHELDKKDVRLSHQERVPALYEKLQFMSREEILAQAFRSR
jgi:hypothetical protein